MSVTVATGRKPDHDDVAEVPSGRLDRRPRDLVFRKRARGAGARTHVDNQRQQLVDLGLEGESLGLLRHDGRWLVVRDEPEVR